MLLLGLMGKRRILLRYVVPFQTFILIHLRRTLSPEHSPACRPSSALCRRPHLTCTRQQGRMGSTYTAHRRPRAAVLVLRASVWPGLSTPVCPFRVGGGAVPAAVTVRTYLNGTSPILSISCYSRCPTTPPCERTSASLRGSSRR
ncbi:unnamed protein product [Amoebophrya sp. A25]|nr:unnamed protein product [Amoebophrya sp. A25]|eukprot:GSA25T00018004001.1